MKKLISIMLVCQSAFCQGEITEIESPIPSTVASEIIVPACGGTYSCVFRHRNDFRPPIGGIHYDFYGFQSNSVPEWASVSGVLPTGDSYRYHDHGEVLLDMIPYLGTSGANWDVNGEHTKWQKVQYTLYDDNTNDDTVVVKMVVEVTPNNTGEERSFRAQLVSQVYWNGDSATPIWAHNGGLYQTSQGNCECFAWMIPIRQRAYGTYEWQYIENPDGKTVTITGVNPVTGDMMIPSMINGKAVTSIGDYAFNHCSGLTSVTIPNGITNIGYCAFSHCSELTSITIPNGVTRIDLWTFYDCSSLTSVILPDSVTNISCEAFRNSGLKSITIPNHVMSIGDRAFDGCNNLTNVIVPDSVISIGPGAFEGCRGLADENGLATVRDVLCGYYGENENVIIPDYVTRIEWGVFSNCSEKLFDTNSIPGVKLVDGWVVGYDDSLAGKVNLTGVRGIAAGAFSRCSKLTGVTLPDGMKRIGAETFYDCYNLTDVTIPDSVTSIGNYAFASCGLTNLAMGAGIKYIGDMDPYDGEGCVFDGCDNLTSVDIPDGVIYIGVAAFKCTGLQSVAIPDSVTDIGMWAFVFCSSLTNVVIGNGVRHIGDQAFSFTALKSVMIPASVMDIESSAFYSIHDLSTVIFCGNAPNIGWDAFYEVSPSCVAMVHKSSTGWGVEIPGTWNGVRIEYLTDLIPPIAVDTIPEEVTNTIDAIGFTDMVAVKGAIGGSVSEYERFRKWAQNTIRDENAVVASQHAAVSYLLGADRLVPDMLTQDDIKIESFGAATETGKFTFEVSVTDVGIGRGVTITDANRDVIINNLKKALGVEGSATLTSNTFSSDNIEITFDTPIDGKARFTVTPPSDTGETFFMRVKIK